MKTILLVDDDEDDRTFFEEALNEVNVDTELTMTKDGTELMTFLEETVVEPPPPHLIFLDLNMPRKNGFECLKEIRESPKLKSIPVVILSTSINPKAVETTYALGANCYALKPNSYQNLKKTIEKVLSLELWKNNNRLPKEKFVLALS